jgi:metal-sulfur cluster biosynthetic enzyme
MTTLPLNEATILQTLRQVIDPEVGCNIVDLGLIYSIAIDGARVTVTMTLTTPGCPLRESIAWGVRNALLNNEGVDDTAVHIVRDPPWDPSMMTDLGRSLTDMNEY